MGYIEASARRALELASGDINNACDMLMNMDSRLSEQSAAQGGG